MNLGTQQRLGAVCILTLCAFTAVGQSVLVSPPPPPPVEEQTSSTSDTNQVNTSQSLGGAGSTRSKNPFQWGVVTLHPGVTYGLTYGTGIQSEPGHANNTLIQTLSPGIQADIGSHWRFSYGAGITFYSESAFKDSVSHSLSLAWRTTYEDWSFSLSQSVSLSSDPQAATAQQTDQQIYVTSLGISRQLGSDFSFDLTAGQTVTDASGFTNLVAGTNFSASPVGGTIDWSTMGWLNYHWGPYISTGVGVGFGYNEVATGPDMTYEDYEGRISWQFARKFNFSLNAGAQVRQFQSDQSDLVTPVFGATIQYQPTAATSIYLSASRSISASYYVIGQVTETTSINVGLSQRLFQKYQLGVNAGYANTSYEYTFLGHSLSKREDDYSFIGISLSRSFLSHGTASVSYSASQNSSNSGSYAYSSSQIGMSLSWGY